MAKKNDFVTLITSPITGKTFVARRNGRKFLSLKDAEKTVKELTPKFPKKLFKVRVKKVGILDKIINP